MRHTRLLRQLVRETLLSEAAITPDRAAKGGLTFLASVNDIDSPSGVAAIDVFLNREDKPPVIVGRLRSRAASGQPCGNPRAWVISWSNAKVNGLGPLMYDLMIDIINPHPLMSDRESVSADAKSVWDYYLDNRSDIEVVQLDDSSNRLTDDPNDNCEQDSAVLWAAAEFADEPIAPRDSSTPAGAKYPDGQPGRWPDVSLSKAYRRREGGTPTLDRLSSLGVVRLTKN